MRYAILGVLVCAATLAACDKKAAPQKPASSGAGNPAATGTVVTFTDANFQSEVVSSKQPVLVDFWATWCVPCKQVAPVVEQLAGEYSGKVKVGKLDTDQNPRTAGSYKVSSIPVLMVFKNGKVVDQVIGFYGEAETKKALKAALDKAMAS